MLLVNVIIYLIARSMISNGRICVDLKLKVMVDIAVLWPVLKCYLNITLREVRYIYQTSRPASRESNCKICQLLKFLKSILNTETDRQINRVSNN